MGTLRHMISACWLCDLQGWGGVARPDHVVAISTLVALEGFPLRFSFCLFWTRVIIQSTPPGWILVLYS